MQCKRGALTLVLLTTAIAGCRSQSTTMNNPFLAPDRVPPPSTRALMPGTAQPYYPGDPVPNTPLIGTPPAGFPPGTTLQPSTPTFAPQPAGAVPPGGWNTSPQAVPFGSSSTNVMPGSIQQASAEFPIVNQDGIQIQQDQQSLRFAGSPTTLQQPSIPAASIPATSGQFLPPDPSILPTPQQGTSSYAVQQAGFESPLPQQQIIQQVAPVSDPLSDPREVRIRAISSDYLPTDGGAAAHDGFRPQGSSQVRKPTIVSRLTPQRVEQPEETADRFGFSPKYDWLRGQLEYAVESGEWSLRYLPRQDSTDPFGGRLAIANPEVLGRLQSGDFVMLRGQVGQFQTGDSQGPPRFSVSVVQRQRI